MARHRVDSRTAQRVAPTAPRRHSGGRHAARPAARATPRAVVARRIAMPAASVAVAGVVTIGGAVAFTTGSSGGFAHLTATTISPAGTAPQRDASTATTPPVAEGASTATGTGAGTGAAAGQAVAPSPADAAAITAAIRSSELTTMVPPTSYQVVGIRIASSDPNWAWAELEPVTADIDRARGVLHRTTSGWRLEQLGSYEVGCALVPPQVRADLALDCPPASAGTFTA